MHTRQSPAEAGDCGYARPLSSIYKQERSVKTAPFSKIRSCQAAVRIE